MRYLSFARDSDGVDGDGPAATKRLRTQDEECVELLKRWLSGDDGALDEWLGECAHSVDGDVQPLLLQRDRQLAQRELSAKDHEIVALRRKVEALERAIPVPLP